MVKHYTNPVYADYFADPFVWRHDGGVYYAVGTGAIEAMSGVGEARARTQSSRAELRLFTLISSEDLVLWRDEGGALLAPDESLGDYFSAPEVVRGDDGRFYMYYSVGRESQVHQLRVAVSDAPTGPYEDSGETLIGAFDCYFANDPHPFRDDDGQWYLFYARDFINTDDGWPAATGLAARRLESMTRLGNEETVILRPRFEWQRFQEDRVRYGQKWDWFQMEGVSVRKHEGRYYCFYSGGSWQGESYGVDYGVADSPLGAYSDEGSEAGARVLRAEPGRLLGTGHTSLVMGPDGETEYLAYHAWDASMRARRLCFDRLWWTPDGPRCEGPTWTSQEIA